VRGLTTKEVELTVMEAAHLNFESRRLRVDAFVDRHFSLSMPSVLIAVAGSGRFQSDDAFPVDSAIACGAAPVLAASPRTAVTCHREVVQR
jgi:hypothetical protein